MAMYLEPLLDWPRAIEKACCSGSLRAINLGPVLAVRCEEEEKRKRF